jgi:hypothetical protein
MATEEGHGVFEIAQDGQPHRFELHVQVQADGSAGATLPKFAFLEALRRDLKQALDLVTWRNRL